MTRSHVDVCNVCVFGPLGSAKLRGYVDGYDAKRGHVGINTT